MSILYVQSVLKLSLFTQAGVFPLICHHIVLSHTLPRRGRITAGKDQTLLGCFKRLVVLNCIYVTPHLPSAAVHILEETLFQWALFTEAAAFWNRNL